MAGGSRLDNNVFARKLAPFGRFLTRAITIRVLSLTLTSVSGPGLIQNRYVFSQHPCCSRDSKVVFSSMLVATCAISSGFLWIDEFGWLLTRVGSIPDSWRRFPSWPDRTASSTSPRKPQQGALV